MLIYSSNGHHNMCDKYIISFICDNKGLIAKLYISIISNNCGSEQLIL